MSGNVNKNVSTKMDHRNKHNHYCITGTKHQFSLKKTRTRCLF